LLRETVLAIRSLISCANFHVILIVQEIRCPASPRVPEVCEGMTSTLEIMPRGNFERRGPEVGFWEFHPFSEISGAIPADFSALHTCW
jgi:hypothetical protein